MLFYESAKRYVYKIGFHKQKGRVMKRKLRNFFHKVIG
jgi:hypothetical protein